MDGGGVPAWDATHTFTQREKEGRGPTEKGEERNTVGTNVKAFLSSSSSSSIDRPLCQAREGKEGRKTTAMVFGMRVS